MVSQKNRIIDYGKLLSFVKKMKSHENTLKSHENQPKIVKNITSKVLANNCQVQIIASVALETCVQKTLISHQVQKKDQRDRIATKI